MHLPNAVNGCIPSDMETGCPAEIEEELRLLYVAMTRARDHLHIIVPQRFYVTQQAQFGDRHVYAGRTRFIPAGLLHLFDSVSWPPIESVTAEQTIISPEQVMDLRAKIRAMFLGSY